MSALGDRLRGKVVGRDVDSATVRYAETSDGRDELHVECRFSNGEKYAACILEADEGPLADLIASLLSSRHALADYLDAAEAIRSQSVDCVDAECGHGWCDDVRRWDSCGAALLKALGGAA